MARVGAAASAAGEVGPLRAQLEAAARDKAALQSLLEQAMSGLEAEIEKCKALRMAADAAGRAAAEASAMLEAERRRGNAGPPPESTLAAARMEVRRQWEEAMRASRAHLEVRSAV